MGTEVSALRYVYAASALARFPALLIHLLIITDAREFRLLGLFLHLLFADQVLVDAYVARGAQICLHHHLVSQL